MTLAALKELPAKIAPIDRVNAQDVGLYLQEIARRANKPLWMRIVYEAPYFTFSLEEAPQMEMVKMPDGELKEQLRPPRHFMGGKHLVEESYRVFAFGYSLLVQHLDAEPGFDEPCWERAVAITPEPERKVILAALNALIFFSLEQPYSLEAMDLLVQMVDIGELTLPIVIRMYALAESRPQGDLHELIQDAFAGPPTAPFEPSSS